MGADFSRPGDLPVSVLFGRLPAAGSLTEIAVTLGYTQHFGLDRTHASEVIGTEVVMGSPRAFAGLGPGSHAAAGCAPRSSVS